MAAMQAELRTLKVQLEVETARQLQLTQQRDLAWETFKTLSNKVAELNLTRAASNSEVRFAANAVPPVEPMEEFNILLAVALSGFVGLAVAVFIAFLANYMNQPPFLTQNRRAPTIAYR
jgi:uncharacterized protein involved in exopolysaccharide biosynthesis